MASLLLLLYAAFRSIGNGVSSAALHCTALHAELAPRRQITPRAVLVPSRDVHG